MGGTAGENTVNRILREAHGRDNRTYNTVRGILRKGLHISSQIILHQFHIAIRKYFKTFESNILKTSFVWWICSGRDFAE